MRANIYINGQIGSTYNEDGTVHKKGVELADVVLQVEANKDAEGYDVYIKSPGGSIDVGRAIAKYIGSLPNAVTIADEMCASMGTEIHLSVPLERRKMIAGTKYIIHNPLLVGVTGNASELNDAADYIKKYEKEMLAMYHNATGVDKTALEGLMAQETSLTDEQCKALNFVIEVLPKMEKAIAFVENQKNTEIMSKVKVLIASAIAGIKEELGIKVKKVEPKAEVLSNTDGTASIYTDKPVSDFIADNSVEVKVFSDEAMTTPFADGEFETPKYKVTVANGIITAVEMIEAEATVEELQARISQLESERESVEANLRAEFEQELATQLNELKGEIGSNYSPKGEAKKFTYQRKPEAVSKKSPKEEAKERKEQYKSAKK